MSAPVTATSGDVSAPNSAAGAGFDALLETVRHAVDEELATWLAPKVESARQISEEVGEAATAVQSLALRGGKRMRAALVAVGFASGSEASSGDAAGVRRLLRDVSRAALAIELLQVYLLIHDDWMDDDDVRRGGPSVHVALRERLGSTRLGDAVAILAGDLACAFAQEALLEVPLPAEHRLMAMRAFAAIQQDVVRGQIAEMCAGPLSVAPSVEQVHALKTASYTVTGPLLLGAHLAGAADARIERLERYGRPLGVAFQLRDDLLGTFGDSSVTGKPVGNDIRQGKRTALVAELCGDAKAVPLLRKVLGRADATDEAIAEVVSLMVTSGAKARVESRVTELLKQAREEVSSMNLPKTSCARLWLLEAVNALGDRSL